MIHICNSRWVVRSSREMRKIQAIESVSLNLNILSALIAMHVITKLNFNVAGDYSELRL